LDRGVRSWHTISSNSQSVGYIRCRRTESESTRYASLVHGKV
jgi:hypothetical protein